MAKIILKDMSKNNLITCAFTSYNAEDSIEKALYSAINQTYDNTEILVVDDYSLDNTLLKIKKISKENKTKIRIIQNVRNMGVAYSRNRCIDNSEGEFICFFDDDDISSFNRIEKQLASLKKYEKMNLNGNINKSPLCFADRKIHYSNNKKLYCKGMSTSRLESYKDEYIISLLSAGPFPKYGVLGSTATCTLFARKSTFITLDMFDETLRRCEDLELSIRALKKGISLISNTNILVNQYYSNTEDKFNAHLYELKVIELNKDWLKKRNLYEFSILYTKLRHSFLRLEVLKFNMIFFKLIYKFPLKLIKNLISSAQTVLFSILHKIYI